MGTEDRELGPFKPAPDMLILAAIERAICHGASDAWIVVVGEHFGFERTAHNTRRLRLQLEHLGAKHKWAASSERYGREYLRLTPAGQRHLAAAAAKEGLTTENLKMVLAGLQGTEHLSW